jgi:hypothetical protein
MSEGSMNGNVVESLLPQLGHYGWRLFAIAKFVMRSSRNVYICEGMSDVRSALQQSPT